MKDIDNFTTKKTFSIDDIKYYYFSLSRLFENFNINHTNFPCSKKILIENIIRNSKQNNIKFADMKKILSFSKFNKNNLEISFFPARVLMQDFTGIPAIADLVAMRSKLYKEGLNPKLINPSIPVDLVIDHSISVDYYGNKKSYSSNVQKEYERNIERYEFLKWSQKSFSNFNVVPPGAGICHQVNLENISKTVWVKKVNNLNYVFPDSLIGTDSHTTMVNALSVLGWGVGGIEAEAAMLGEPISINMPEIVGVSLEGKLNEGITATDLVLNITETLRKTNVVGKFVEFFGNGLDYISLPDRATISNMAPEYGATCGFFPVDNQTLEYLKLTARTTHQIKLVEKYSKLQGIWRYKDIFPKFDKIIKINLNSIGASLAGPRRPQDKLDLKDVPQSFQKNYYKNKFSKRQNKFLQDGSIAIAAITSCTNTSNPHVLIAAGLLAKKARKLGLTKKSFVKASLAPGSQVVSEYLLKSGLMKYLNQLGFYNVGYGCTTCIGNSGPLDKNISKKIDKNNLILASVLSGNRNFEGRIHPEIKANYLASPPLVVAYAIAGNININLNEDPIEEIFIKGKNKKIFLKDLWPKNDEINKIINKFIKKDIFTKKYKKIFDGDENWKKIKTNTDLIYKWNSVSTYVKQPPFLTEEKNLNISNIKDARILAMLGDSITTDHISPAGLIKEDSPAGKYLKDRQVPIDKFNSYGSRRANHEIMMRGTFSNIRLKNELSPKTEGGITKSFISGKFSTIFDTAIEYIKNDIPLVIIAGKEYGTGSSRDWAAKGTKLLGVKAVIAESYERIHRSNLIGMGVVPFEFISNENRKSLKLEGDEKFTIEEDIKNLKPKKIIKCKIAKRNNIKTINLLCRIDTNQELKYFKSGGILNYVLNNIRNNLK